MKGLSLDYDFSFFDFCSAWFIFFKIYINTHMCGRSVKTVEHFLFISEAKVTIIVENTVENTMSWFLPSIYFAI